ncbi:hypothetical protein [Natrinema pallidum]|uniref:hypothetical protein n=1 Tax=Natrinema pallidum TaxID=69527 RepID=UPI000ADA4466|nr:hypothetical protein [Natrinema pallidum]
MGVTVREQTKRAVRNAFPWFKSELAHVSSGTRERHRRATAGAVVFIEPKPNS